MCVAVPLRVMRVDGDWAVLEAGSGELSARTDLVDVGKGDYVLVHAGFVIEKIDPGEARKTLEMFREISPGGR